MDRAAGAREGSDTSDSGRYFRLVVEFDGSEFEGWQIQGRGERTVQGCLKQAAERLMGGAAQVTGSSRTDSGVHAAAMAVSLRGETDLDPEALRRALNGVLPPDIAVLELAEASADFDVRRQARWKTYRYAIWNARERSPLRAGRWLHVRQALDVEAMRLAAAQLVGRHDFRSFQASGSGVTDTVRSLYRVEIQEPAPGEIVIEIEGSGFLRYMVRNLVGTLLEVARGRRRAEGIPALLAARDRSQAGPTAAPHGLTLVRVVYSPHPREVADGRTLADSPSGRKEPAQAIAGDGVSAGKSEP